MHVGQHPVPTRLKEALGNPGKRKLCPEPEPEVLIDLPLPPDYLNQIAGAEWRRIAPQLLRLRLLTNVDIAPLAAYCEAYARWVEAQRQLKIEAAADPEHKGLLVRARSRDSVGFIVNPLIGVIREAAKEMMRHALEFGFTPAARTRIASGLNDPGPKSKFAGLLAS
jgi:P27 family predicted phage terminase small subunit